MLQSERDAERFYEAQRKFEQRQRMIDKGWECFEHLLRVYQIKNGL